MALKLSKEEQDNIEKLRNISGENQERVHNVLRSLMFLVIQNYSEKESVQVPYFGSLFIKYKGDIVTPKGREADLDVFFNPSDFLKQNIGYVEDAKKGKVSLLDIPVIKLLQTSNKKILKSQLSDSYKEVEESLD